MLNIFRSEQQLEPDAAPLNLDRRFTGRDSMKRPPLSVALIYGFLSLLCLGLISPSRAATPDAENSDLRSAFEQHLDLLKVRLDDLERQAKEEPTRRQQDATATPADDDIELRWQQLARHLDLVEQQVLESGSKISDPLRDQLNALRAELNRAQNRATRPVSGKSLGIEGSPGKQSFSPSTWHSIDAAWLAEHPWWRPSGATGWPAVKGAPTNDSCANALPVTLGTIDGSVAGATRDGSTTCASLGRRDVWFRYTPTSDGPIAAYFTEDVDNLLVVSVHSGCPGDRFNQIACGTDRGLVFDGRAGESVLLRVAGDPQGFLDFSLRLAAAGRIVGEVRKAGDNTPATPSQVRIYSHEGRFVRTGDVRPDGTYTVPVAKAGDYFAEARGEVFAPQRYDHVACPNDICDDLAGTLISVSEGDERSGIDFDLEPLGRISGRVTDASNGQPISGATVRAVNNGNFFSSVATDSSGAYSLDGLPTGEVFVGAFDSDYLAELYDDIPCMPDCNQVIGTPIQVVPNSHIQGIDLSLEPFGGIEGRVTDAGTGQPVHLAVVEVYSLDGQLINVDASDIQGHYSIGGLAGGPYQLLTGARNIDYFGKVYRDIPCAPSGCDPSLGSSVTVAPFTTTGGIDFTLDPLGTVSGTVRDNLSGEGIGSAEVDLVDGQSLLVSTTTSETDGSYTLTGIPPGVYFLWVTQGRHVAQVFGGPSCPDTFACDLTSGMPIPVPASANVVGIEIRMDRLGTISGTVSDADTGQPITVDFVQAWDSDGQLARGANLELDGTYRLEGLLPGSYTVTAQSFGHRGEVYPDLPCDGPSCDPTTGTPIDVDINQDITGIDFALTRKGAITGTLFSEAGDPLPHGLKLWSSDGQRVASAVADFDGSFEFPGLDAGVYYLSSDARFFGYIDRVFGGETCNNGVCDPLTGTPIVVDTNVTTTGIDLVITRLGVISGRVQDAIFLQVLNGVTVNARDSNGIVVASDSTDDTGSYEIVGLEPGGYRITAFEDGFLGQRYPEIPCPDGDCAAGLGEVIDVDLNTEANDIDFTLALRQGIAGSVRDEATGLPVVGAVVEVFSGNTSVEALQTGASGRFLISLPVGTYYLRVDTDASPFDGMAELYNDIPCPRRSSCDPTDGDPVTVSASQVTTGIDFDLEGQICSPSGRVLCLNDQRFRVRMSFTDFDGNLALAGARPLTDDSGTFYFFDPDNLEVVVKVLDACVAPFNHFWVFTTGLTNLQTSISVEDTLTGDTRIYTNPLGTPFQLIRDVTAFDTCDGNSATAGTPILGVTEDPAAPTALALQLENLDKLLSHHPVPTSIVEPSSKTTGPCVPSSTALCLQESRFRVEAEWAAPDGAAGQGQAVPLTADTGYFWFFANDNVEVILKVLDACGANDFNSFWVFAAGLTDVEVTLKITDTLSGEERIYSNPQGSPFVPVQDTAAFQTCP